MTVKAVIFDVGNVLLEWKPEAFYAQKYGADRAKAFFAETDVEAVNYRIDQGAPFKSSLYDYADQVPEYAAEIRDWHDSWLQMASPEIPHSVRLLRALQAKGAPVFALTNFGIETWEIARGVFPFLDEFDRLYHSGHMKVAKPSPRIYEMVEEDCGLSGDELIFADDREENLATAGVYGWKTHLFKDPAGWADRLVAEGLLKAEEAV